jgi:hypothetical protein
MPELTWQILFITALNHCLRLLDSLDAWIWFCSREFSAAKPCKLVGENAIGDKIPLVRTTAAIPAIMRATITTSTFPKKSSFDVWISA